TRDPLECPVLRFPSQLSLTETVTRARAFAAAVDPARLPLPDDSTPPLGATLTPEEQALSHTAALTDQRTTRSVPETRTASLRADESQTTSAAPVERPPVPEPAGAPA